MFHSMPGMECHPTVELTGNLDRPDKMVPSFVHKCQCATGADEFVLSEVYQADEGYDTIDEQGSPQEQPRDRLVGAICPICGEGNDRTND